MKINKYIGMTMIVAATIPAVTSCTDYDDYNEARRDINAGADKTLWQNIVANPELSEFADLVRRAGFDKELDGSKTYTVFVPVNDALDETKYEGMEPEMLLKRFVKNHVANYSFAASGEVNERVRMLNNKSNMFQGAGTYTFGGLNVKEANIPGVNGVMHTLDNVLDYRDNIYDYIMLTDKAPLFTEYMKKYEQKILDKANSVIGPIVDGKQTYLDSVMIVRNHAATNILRAQLESEDSSYTVLLPTDKAWQDQKAKISNCYNYIANTLSQDILNTDKITDSDIPNTTMDNIDAAYYKDSLSTLMLVKDLVYSNNNYYNRWMETPEFTSNDTIRSTTGNKLSQPEKILAETTEKIQLSNGVGRVIDSLAASSWDVYNYERIFNASISRHRVINSAPVNIESFHRLPDGTIEPFYYLLAQSPSKNAKPSLDIVLPNVLSTKYNFYVVVVPPKEDNIQSINGYDTDMPNSLNFVLNYCDAKGKLANWKFSSDLKDNPSKALPFINDTAKIDTMFIGSFTFPVCYYGLKTQNGAAVQPVLKITSSINAFLETQKKQNTMDLRIADVILRPVELDEADPLTSDTPKSN